MATYGFQAYDAGGYLIAEITDRLTKVLGMVYITANTSGSVGHGDLTTATGWYAFMPDWNDDTIHGMINPAFVVNNGSISWSYPEAGNANAVNTVFSGYMLYGVY